MLVICEDCAKKYSIDEHRIKASKVKFNCRSCGHIIIVEKPSEEPSGTRCTEQKTVDTDSQASKEADDTDAVEPSPAVRAALRRSRSARKGPPFAVYLLAVMLFGLLMISTIFIHFYLNTIPDILRNELELRSQALTESLKKTIILPFSRSDYLTVNQEIERVGKLPGVAYAAVRNAKGVLVAGFFDNLNTSDKDFARKMKEREFQSEILAKNTIPPGGEKTGVEIHIGELPVYNRVTALPDGGGELYMGLSVENLNKYFFKALLSPLTLTLLLLFLLSGYLLFFLLSKLITGPMRALTDTANRISLGELDLAVTAAGPREIRELGAAFERMRHSIRVATERLSR